MTEVAGPIMSHESRTSPYAATGTAFAATTDAAEALRRGGLEFTVTKETLQSVVLGDGVTTLPFTDKFATVRHDADGKVSNLGVVGSQYVPIQNADVANLLQQVADSSDGVFKAVGATHGGARTFVQMGMPEGIMIGGVDPVDVSIVVFNDHRGEAKATGIPTATRIFCCNQFPTIKKSLTKFSVRHTGAGIAAWNVEEVRKAISLTFLYAKEIEADGELLIRNPMTTVEFGQFVDKLSPVVEHAKTGKELETSAVRRATLKQIFTGAENLANVRGTQWAALQSVIEYEDWFRPTAKGTTPESRMVARSTDDIKLRATALLLGR